MANALGISRGSISYYENGDRTADIEILEKISNFFSVDYDYLLGRSAFTNSEHKTRVINNSDYKLVPPKLCETLDYIEENQEILAILENAIKLIKKSNKGE